MIDLEFKNSPQLALGLALSDEARFINFLTIQENETLIAALTATVDTEAEQLMYIHGGLGAGKSHLLQACCHRAGEIGKSALYLPMEQLAGFNPAEVLEGIENLDLVCLDELQSVAGDKGWEEALFHYLNRVRSSGVKLIVAAETNPRELDIRLEDLRSRLAWAMVFKLHELDDEGKQAMLQLRAHHRGLDLGADVARYIVSRASREMGELMALLEQLDRASLAAKRSLSQPFVKQTLGW